jgi:hypothetical protein
MGFKAKTILAVAALTVCATFALAWKLNAANGPGAVLTTVNTARFTIFSGVYTLSGGMQESGVFRLDSYTGDAWRLKVDVVNNEKIAIWVPIINPPVQSPAVSQ